MPVQAEYDAVVIGAGFSGLYLLHRLRDDLGLNVKVFERADGVGGTWYWNRYPGSRCDVNSLAYSYSFSEELQQEWDWSEKFAPQPEILSYLNHVADRFDLRKDIELNTNVESASFDEKDNVWLVHLDGDRVVRTPWLVTAVGCLSAARIPEIDGMDSFAGPIYQTAAWPHEGVDFAGQRVAVIGTGSSGVQAIPLIAEQAEHLTVFQRTPNFSIPARNRPLGDDEIAEHKSQYAKWRAIARKTAGGFVLHERPEYSALEVDDETRTEILEHKWDEGSALFLNAFTDTAIDLDANERVAEFVRDKIRGIVNDPAVAELLCPSDHPIGTKRPCLDTNYFETYNRHNVTLVSIRDTPIDRITANAVVVDGVEHEVDAIVLATGFDAMTGPLTGLNLTGVGGIQLRDAWSAGPRTYLGLATHGFPNLFTVTGPGSPSVLSNMVVSIEQHVDWITDLIEHARAHAISRIEATLDAQDEWVEHVNELSHNSLFYHASSWYLGANVPGKPRVFMPYLGGVGRYRKVCDAVAADNYRGFELTTSDAVAYA